MSYTSFQNNNTGATQFALLQFRKSNDFLSVGANDSLARIVFSGYDAVTQTFKLASYIECLATGAPSTNVPSEIRFVTTNGTTNHIAMSVGDDGQVDIANPTANVTTLVVVNDQTSPNINLRTANATATNSPHVHFTRSRAGTADVQASDDLGRLEFRGFQGGTAIEAADIRAQAETVNGASVSGSIQFRTRPTTYAAINTRMNISADGNVTISTPVSGTALTISGGGETITAGNLTLSAGNVNLTTTSATSGIINVNATRFMHAYGTNNTFLGSSAGNFTLTATQATAIGASAGNNITTGGNSVYIGYQAGNTVSGGNENTVIGSQAFASANASQNVVIGYQAGFASTGFTACTAVGKFALNNTNTGLYNLMLGYGSGTNYNAGESSNICLHSDGVAGESNVCRIGQSTGTGNRQIQNAYIQGYVNLPGQPSFHAWILTPQLDVTGDGTSYDVIFQAVRHNVSSSYNPTTGVFTAPVSGKYMFTSQVIYEGLTAGMTWGALGFWVNGASYIGGISYVNPVASAALGTFYSNQGTVIMDISAGDTVQVRIFVAGGAKVVDLNLQTASFFAGQLLS